MTFLEQEEIKLNKIREQDRKARENGTLIGRLLSFQIYDGFARYQIEEELPNNEYKLKYIDFMDGYTEPVIEYMERIVPKKLIDNYFRVQEKLKKLLGKD